MRSRILTYAIGVTMAVSAVAPQACIDPLSKYYAGAVLNSGEFVDFSKLEALGTEGVNYLRVCDTTVRIGDTLHVYPSGVTIKVPADPIFNAQARVQFDMLTISLSYGGGCAEHLFGLHTTGALGKSLPPVVDLVLSHDAQGDACKAIVGKTLTFDLSPLLPLVNGATNVRLSLLVPGDPTPLLVDWTPTPYFSCSYSYRSHVSDRAMVYLGYFAPGYQIVQPSPRIAVYFDTTAVPSSEENANAVAAELRWLVGNGVVSGISDAEIGAMQSALVVNPEQYWTLQDTVLDYNMWFGGGVRGQTSGVYGVNGVRGGCGLGAAYALPTQALGSNAAVHLKTDSSRPRSFTVAQTRHGVLVRLAEPLGANDRALVYDVNGALIARVKVLAGVREFVWDKRCMAGRPVSSGHYIVVIEGTLSTRLHVVVGP